MTTTTFLDQWEDLELRKTQFTKEQQRFIRKAILIIFENLLFPRRELIQQKIEKPDFHPEVFDHIERQDLAMIAVLQDQEEYLERSSEDSYNTEFEKSIINLIKQDLPKLQTTPEFFKFVLQILKCDIQSLQSEAHEESLLKMLDRENMTEEEIQQQLAAFCQSTEQIWNEKLSAYKTFFEEAQQLFSIKAEELLEVRKPALAELKRSRYSH